MVLHGFEKLWYLILRTGFVREKESRDETEVVTYTKQSEWNVGVRIGSCCAVQRFEEGESHEDASRATEEGTTVGFFV